MIEQTDLATIEFQVADHVATVALNRPEKMNSFTEQMAAELAAVWARVRDDEDIRAAVLCANGERAFCTGIDVTEGTWWKHRPIFNQEDPGELLGPKAHKVWKPVIAALHGIVAAAPCTSSTSATFRSAVRRPPSLTHMPTRASSRRWSRWACWPLACPTAR